MWLVGMMGVGKTTIGERAAAVVGAPFYDTYRCADDKWICVGALEPQFFAELLARLKIPASEFPSQVDRSCWPAMRARFEQIFLSETQAHWCQLLENTDACFAPILPMSEAINHPHNVARGTFVDHAGIVQPAPAPRFSGTPAALRKCEFPVAATEPTRRS